MGVTYRVRWDFVKDRGKSQDFPDPVSAEHFANKLAISGQYRRITITPIGANVGEREGGPANGG